MDAGDLAELRALRARAYGPDADIDADPTAVARLRQLEQPVEPRGRDDRPTVPTAQTGRPGALPPVPDAPTAGAGDGAADTDGAAPADDPGASRAAHPDRSAGAVTGAAPSPAPRPAALRRARVRLALLWAGSIAVAVLVTAWVATSTAPPRSTASGAHYDAALSRDDSVAPPTFLEEGAGTGIHGFAEYAGLTPFVVDSQQTQQGVQTCLVLVATTGLPGTVSTFDGTVASGCAAAPFTPQITIRVGDSAPEAMRQQFQDGAVLQFVFTGDEVEVFEADPAETPTS